MQAIIENAHVVRSRAQLLFDLDGALVGFGATVLPL